MVWVFGLASVWVLLGLIFVASCAMVYTVCLRLVCFVFGVCVDLVVF